MLAIEDVVGAPAAAGVATRKSFFFSTIVSGCAQSASHDCRGNDRHGETVPPAPPHLLGSDNRGLRFSQRRGIPCRDGKLPCSPGYTRQHQGRGLGRLTQCKTSRARHLAGNEGVEVEEATEHRCLQFVCEAHHGRSRSWKSLVAWGHVLHAG